MSEEQSYRETLAAYLSSIKGDYPGGIPCFYIEEAEQAVAQMPYHLSGAKGSKLAFVRCTESYVGDSDAGSELLVSAITKGLNRSLEEVSIYTFSSEAELPPLFENYSHEFIICLGLKAADLVLEKVDNDILGKWHKEEGCNVLVTYDVDQIVADKQLKRPFWEHLQMLLKELEA